jgi:hypothetical protein
MCHGGVVWFRVNGRFEERAKEVVSWDPGPTKRWLSFSTSIFLPTKEMEKQQWLTLQRWLLPLSCSCGGAGTQSDCESSPINLSRPAIHPSSPSLCPRAPPVTLVSTPRDDQEGILPPSPFAPSSRRFLICVLRSRTRRGKMKTRAQTNTLVLYYIDYYKTEGMVFASQLLGWWLGAWRILSPSLAGGRRGESGGETTFLSVSDKLPALTAAAAAAAVCVCSLSPCRVPDRSSPPCTGHRRSRRLHSPPDRSAPPPQDRQGLLLQFFLMLPRVLSSLTGFPWRLFQG